MNNYLREVSTKAELFSEVSSFLQSEHLALEWFDSYNHVLSDYPRNLLDSDVGRRQLEEYIFWFTQRS